MTGRSNAADSPTGAKLPDRNRLVLGRYCGTTAGTVDGTVAATVETVGGTVVAGGCVPTVEVPGDVEPPRDEHADTATATPDRSRERRDIMTDNVIAVL